MSAILGAVLAVLLIVVMVPVIMFLCSKTDSPSEYQQVDTQPAKRQKNLPPPPPAPEEEEMRRSHTDALTYEYPKPSRSGQSERLPPRESLI
jgi:hypothetical protein